jgi:hypothetical protein
LVSLRKKRDSSTAIVPLGKDFKVKFNELDNWLGIMDVDPPRDEAEKKAMYLRLIDILDNLFEAERTTKSRRTSRKIRSIRVRPSKIQIQEQMQRIIPR